MEGACYNLHAPGGSGKNVLANLILSYMRMQHNITIETAISGIVSKGLVYQFHASKILCSKANMNANEAKTIKNTALI